MSDKIDFQKMQSELEFKKMLNDHYPSRHLQKQIKEGSELLMKSVAKDNKAKNNSKKASPKNNKKEKVNEPKEKEKPVEKKDKKGKMKVDQKKNKRRKLESDDDDDMWEEYDEEEDDEYETADEDDDDYDDDDDDEDYEEDDDEEEDEDEYCEEYEENTKNGKKLNIFLTIGNAEEEEEWDSYDEYELSETSSETEDENVSVSSVSTEEDEPRKKSHHMKTRQKGNESKSKSKSSPKKELSKKGISNKEEESEKEIKPQEGSKNSHSENELLEILKGLQTKSNNAVVKNCIDLCQQEIEHHAEKKSKKEKKQKDKNMRIYRKINRNKNVMNDVKFFKKMDVDQQKKIITELKSINRSSSVDKPYKLSIIESELPTTFKATAMKKLTSLRYMEPGSGEYYKIKNWVDTFMSIPFGKYNELPINLENDGVDKCHEFMEFSQKTLNDAVYGLNDAKMQIMQLLGQYITNPAAIGSAIAIHGPPGTGKTSLVREGISKILNRPFAFLALGGATDSSFLEGHSYTYEGSTWGKIVQILVDSKCMNPVIYFDELDKISDTPKGEEIAGILTHLTDTSQNSQFHDKYFAEIDFDLSKCLFIFSYNDESKVNPILKDRMYRIQTCGYNQKQKTIIANNYLLPKIREQVKFQTEDIIISDETVHYIIDNFAKEDGVRTLKRCLEIIYTKLNLYRLMKPGTNIFEEDMSLKVEFPFNVSKSIVDKLIKTKKDTSYLYGLYV